LLPDHLQHGLLSLQNSFVLRRIVLKLHFDHVRHRPQVHKHLELRELCKGLDMVSLSLFE
jgi:hypothetical protein